MLFSDDIDEVLRAAARLSTERRSLAEYRAHGAGGSDGAGSVRSAISVAEEALELAVRVAVERSPPTWHEHRKTQDEIGRRRW